MEKKLSLKKLDKSLRIYVIDYNSAIVVAALYKKLYGLHCVAKLEVGFEKASPKYVPLFSYINDGANDPFSKLGGSSFITSNPSR